jgi:uncharacterized repeat protein (TIGR01451 family)
MKHSLPWASLGLALALTFAPVAPLPLGSAPALSQTQTQQQNLELELTGQLRVTRRNLRGQEEIAWQSLESSFLRPAPTVQPGDILRYTISGNNRTDQPIGGLVLTDDLPPNTIYVMGSAAATGNGNPVITYSIDGGKTYTANPTIQVTLPDGRVETRPAPADRYTHVRWTFQNPVAARATVTGQYQVRVR